MKLHSDLLTSTLVHAALRTTQASGHVAGSVYFHIFAEKGSRSRSNAFEIQLGCWDKVKGDNRGWKNSGGEGASDVYAATYAEWGYFIAALVTLDPDLIFGPYKGADDFHAQTGYMFAATVPQPDPYPYLLDDSRRPVRFATLPTYAPAGVAYSPRFASQLTSV